MKGATELMLSVAKDAIGKQPIFKIVLTFKCTERLFYNEIALMRENFTPLHMHYSCTPAMMNKYFNHVNPLTEKK